MKTIKLKIANNCYDFSSIIGMALVIIFLLFAFIFRTSTVFGESMENTLFQGDRVVVSTFNYTPKTGDIVIISQPNQYEVNLVKRVIAVGGQTVYIDSSNGNIVVNNQVLTEPYIKETTKRLGNVNYPLTVPEGYVFVMGDNRNESLDSRFAEIGFIDERYIIGEATFKMEGFKFSKLGIAL